MKLLSELLSNYNTAKSVKEDWGTSDWSILLSYIERDVERGENVEDAVNNMADSYFKQMGYDTAEEAKDAIMNMAQLRKKHWAAGKDTNWPKLIAQTDEFRAELDEDRQVNIMDGEGTVRLTMPVRVFKAFVQEAEKYINNFA